jgi:hypothetical protein
LALCERVSEALYNRSSASYQANHLYATAIELILELCERAELGCAYGREVGGVREEDRPAALNELVELNVSVGSLRCEVWCCMALAALRSHLKALRTH